MFPNIALANVVQTVSTTWGTGADIELIEHIVRVIEIEQVHSYSSPP